MYNKYTPWPVHLKIPCHHESSKWNCEWGGYLSRTGRKAWILYRSCQFETSPSLFCLPNKRLGDRWQSWWSYKKNPVPRGSFIANRSSNVRETRSGSLVFLLHTFFNRYHCRPQYLNKKRVLLKVSPDTTLYYIFFWTIHSFTRQKNRVNGSSLS